MRLPVISQTIAQPRRRSFSASWRRRISANSSTFQCAWSISSCFVLFFAAVSLIPYLTSSGYNVLKMVLGSYLLLWAFLIFNKQTSFQKIQTIIGQRKIESLALVVWFLVVILNGALGRGTGGWLHVYLSMYMLLFISMNWAYSTVRPELLNGLRVAIIIMLGVQAAISLPVLYGFPGIARLVMHEDARLFEFGVRHGVGEYSLYTALAIGFPMMLATALAVTGIKRILAFASCVAILLSILLSTFTGASSLVIAGAILFLIAVSVSSGKRLLKKATYVLILIGLLGSGIYLLRDTEQFRFEWNKATTITEDSAQHGVVKGDYTGRGLMATWSLNTFLDNPIIGVGPTPWASAHKKEDNYVGGHSSWIDGLAEYGLAGYGFYLFFLGTIFIELLRDLREKRRDDFAKERFISLILLLIGGIINPITFQPRILFIFFFFVVTRPLTPVAQRSQRPYATLDKSG